MGGASRSRVCYQRGLPRLVSSLSSFNHGVLCEQVLPGGAWEDAKRCDVAMYWSWARGGEGQPSVSLHHSRPYSLLGLFVRDPYQ